jgi:hypothetical protein
LSCGAMIVVAQPRCRYCGALSGEGDAVEMVDVDATALEPKQFPGIDGFSLMVALAATAFPVHAWLLGQVPPYSVPVSAMQMDLRYGAAALCGAVVGSVWRPRATRGLLLLLMFSFHLLAFVQMSSWRSGVYGLSSDLWGLGAAVGGVSVVGVITGMVLRWLATDLVRLDGSASTTLEL